MSYKNFQSVLAWLSGFFIGSCAIGFAVPDQDIAFVIAGLIVGFILLIPTFMMGFFKGDNE